MAQLIIQVPGLSGGNIALQAAAAAGDTFANDGRTYLRVRNGNAGGGASVTATIASPTVCNQGGNHPVVVNVPAAEERTIGPFDPSRFAVNVGVAYSAVANVTVAAHK